MTVAVTRGAVTLTTSGPAETRAVGRRLGTRLRGGEVIALTGDLGSGKTCFIQGLAEGLGIDAHAVTSPTFVFLHQHRGRLPLYHLDLYRAETAEDAEALGLFETIFAEPGAVAAIEWADRAAAALPAEHLMIRLVHLTRHARGRGPDLTIHENRRRLRLEAHGPRYLTLLENLRAAPRA